MPLYEYECKKCKCRFELVQRVNDPRVSRCPKCEGKVRRVIHPNAVIFKGSGFYSTDKHEVKK